MKKQCKVVMLPTDKAKYGKNLAMAIDEPFHLPKTTWTRDEVINLMTFALDMGFDLANDPLPRLLDISGRDYLNQWIEDNL
jgi:hypothetical protein